VQGLAAAEAIQQVKVGNKTMSRCGRQAGQRNRMEVEVERYTGKTREKKKVDERIMALCLELA